MGRSNWIFAYAGLATLLLMAALFARVEPDAPDDARLGPMRVVGYEPEPYVLPHVGETTLPPITRQGDARVVVEFINPEAVASACAGSYIAAGTGGPPLACAQADPARPRLVLPNPCAFPWDDYAVMACHELGHVHGWTHEREGAA